MTQDEATSRAQQIIERCYERLEQYADGVDGLQQLDSAWWLPRYDCDTLDWLRDEITAELIEVTHEIKSEGQPPRTPGP